MRQSRGAELDRARSQAVPAESASMPADAGPILTDRQQDVPVAQLRELLDTTYWAAGRSPEVLRVLLDNSVVVAALEEGSLVGFARALSDTVCRAWVYDVVVRPDRRKRGIARRMMQFLLAHPRMANVEVVNLTTRDAEPLYAGLGFKTVSEIQSRHGRCLTMRLDR